MSGDHNMTQLPHGYEPHEIPADYTGKLWIEGQLRQMQLKLRSTFVGLDLQEMDEIINGNLTITDPNLRDGVYGVVLDTITTLMEKNGYTEEE